jgi:hypothetical protein
MVGSGIYKGVSFLNQDPWFFFNFANPRRVQVAQESSFEEGLR